jgi:hypothetical protein
LDLYGKGKMEIGRSKMGKGKKIKVHNILESKNVILTVLDPQGQPAPGVFKPLGPASTPKKEGKLGSESSGEIKPLSMAPRLDTLDGKTVYLVDCKFGGGYEFLREMQAWFSKNMPAVKTVLKPKLGDMFTDDPGLWAEVKERGDAVVMGVGG